MEDEWLLVQVGEGEEWELWDRAGSRWEAEEMVAKLKAADVLWPRWRILKCRVLEEGRVKG